MGWLVKFAKSSIGAKVVMALTGIVLVGFIFGHLAGNLQVFIGQDALNTYAALLHSKPALLWVVRAGLVVAVLMHIGSGIRLSMLNRAARGPEGYRKKQNVKAGLSGRTMALSGVMLLAFLIYHLLHFTVGNVLPEYYILVDSLGRQDVYSMFVSGFQIPAISGSYIVAVVLLGMHLNHGIASMFQSLGLTSARWAPAINILGPVLAWVVIIGNVSMPVAVLMGYITLPGVN